MALGRGGTGQGRGFLRDSGVRCGIGRVPGRYLWQTFRLVRRFVGGAFPLPARLRPVREWGVARWNAA